MVIGTLPVVIAISANLRDHRRDGSLPWVKLVPSLVLIAGGIACANQVELAALSQQSDAQHARYASGALLAIGAVACWTWYPLRNADWLRDHPGRKPRAWATAQGLAVLPMALVGYAIFWVWHVANGDAFPMPFGPRPAAFVGLMAAIGLFSSWVGTLCWNQASQRLPTSLVGQLIVFETLAALGYAYLLHQRWPEPLVSLGVALLVVGVLWAVRIKPVKKNPALGLG
jgi:drug/metabolite transporter (DMT)-like permease